jgi:uncharacterized protein (DUF1697 family)
METYVALFRGIKVGSKNNVLLAELREFLGQLGFAKVSTYIASGNVILVSAKSPAEISAFIEGALPDAFRLDSELVRVLTLDRD